MNINSTSNAYSSMSSSTSGGLSGLVSGMDTEALVEKMLSGQQSKIDAQKQEQQVIGWKQSRYRGIISKINTFGTNYFDILSPNSIVSSSFYNNMSASASSKSFSVTGGASAISGEMRVKIDSLATASKLDGKNLDAANLLSGKFDSDAFNSRVSFTFDKVTETADDGTGAEVEKVIHEAGSIELTEEDINNILNGAAVTKELPGATPDSVEKIKFALNSKGKMEITSDSGDRAFKVDASDASSTSGTTELGLLKLGLTAGNVKGFINTGSKNKEALSYTVNKDVAPTVDITLDGNKKSIEITKDMTFDDFKEKINYAFGDGNITVTGTDFSDYAITTGSGRKVVIGGNKAGMEAMGTKNGQSNTVAMGDTLEHAFGVSGDVSFKINGKEITLKSTDTVSDVMSAVNKSNANVKLEYSDYENKFILSSASTGAGYEVNVEDTDGFLAKIFGASSGETIDDIKATNYTSGQNAQLTINGIATERSSNAFEIDGVAFKLTDTNTEEELVTISRDVDSVVKGIKSFVDDYNKLIDELNGVVGEDDTYRDYPALTEAQKKEMSDSEITAWEKKAQEGLLRHDSDIESFLSSMRLSVLSKPEDSSISVFDIGIDLSSSYKDNGKLTLDESKLREMLEADPDAVQHLFTYSKTKTETKWDGTTQTVPDGLQGVATAFKNAIKAAANTSSASPGTLVQMAGVANSGSTATNTLSLRLNEIKSRIATLQDQYELQKARYWKQFNGMESVISNLSTQSAWLTQQNS